MAARQEIDFAIKKGVAWLKTKQNKDGSYGQWGLGSTCLAIMALVHCNVLNSDPLIKRAISYILNTNPPDSTFFRSLTSMALIVNGEKTPDASYRVQLDITWIIKSQGKEPDNLSSYGGWGETHNSQAADSFSTQLALLALYLAALRGIPVPEQAWNRAIMWYQRNYNINKDGNYYSVIDNPEVYGNGVSFSAAAAALFSLKTISLFSSDQDIQTLAKSLTGYTLDWLTLNYAVELSQDIPDSWYYYYLFSLALGCGIEPYFNFIGTNDWYTDMADKFVLLQKPDGRWVSETDKKSTDVIYTSFALLVLTKVEFLFKSKLWNNNINKLMDEKQKKILMCKAKLPIIKTLDGFDFKHLPRVNRFLIEQLGECEFIEQKENVIFIGNPGTGKTHLAISLGLQACSKGFKVRFYTAAELVDRLVTAQIRRRYSKMEKLLNKIDLLIIDELSYLTLSRPDAELLFRVISARNEKASLIITSNLDFTKWIEIFGDKMLTDAIVDRMNYKSHIIDTHGLSYRRKKRL